MKKTLLISLLLSTASAFAMDNVLVTLPVPDPHMLAQNNRYHALYDRIQYFRNTIPHLIPTQNDIDGLIDAWTAVHGIVAAEDWHAIVRAHFTALLQDRHEVRDAFINRIIERRGIDTNLGLLWGITVHFKQPRDLEKLLHINARPNASIVPLLDVAISDMVMNMLPDNSLQIVYDFTNRQDEKRQALGILLNAGVRIETLMQNNSFPYFQLINPELCAFLIIYLQKEQRLQELYNLRDRDNRSLIEYVRQQPENDHTARILELLDNPEQAATLYPEIERAVQASIDDKPRQARLKYGPKGTIIT